MNQIYVNHFWLDIGNREVGKFDKIKYKRAIFTKYHLQRKKREIRRVFNALGFE